MSSVNIDLAADTILNVMVGQQDENEVREVVFDFSDWYTTYGSGTISLAIQRPKDEWPYEGTLTVDNSTHKATWEISDTDSAYAGVGQIQLSYTVGTAVKKSVVYRFTVHKSLGALGNVITPIQIQTFIDEVTEALEDMQEELNDVKQDLEELQEEIEGGGSGLTADLKAALDQLAQKVAYIDEDGQDYYDALHAALYPPATLTSITCVYTQSGTVYDTDTLDSLKSDLVVTAHYDNSTSQVVTNYTLSGTLTEGTSTITVAYGGKTTTFNVTVSHASDPSEQWTDGVAYSPTVISNEYFKYDTGAITSQDASGWSRTGYLPCRGAKIIEVSAIPQEYSEPARNNVFVDNQFSPVKAGVTCSKIAPCSVPVPSSAYYFGLSSESAALASCISNGITPYASTDWEAGVAYDDIDIVQNKYIDIDHSGVEASYNGWDATDYVPCNGVTTIMFPPLQTGSTRPEYNGFYRKDKSFIKKIILNKSASTSVDVPVDAYYFRLSSESAYLATCIANGIVPDPTSE